MRNDRLDRDEILSLTVYKNICIHLMILFGGILFGELLGGLLRLAEGRSGGNKGLELMIGSPDRTSASTPWLPLHIWL